MNPSIVKLFAASVLGDVSSWDIHLNDDSEDVQLQGIIRNENIKPSSRSFGHGGEVPLHAAIEFFGIYVIANV